jgi:predicted metalloprotease with PDZ domain
MIDYRIEVGDAHSHRFSVTLRVPRPDTNQAFSLPVWIPGSYLVREFARHLTPIEATQGASACQVIPTGKASWQVACQAGVPLTLRYDVYAFDTSVRAAFLDANRGFFNGTSVFLKAEGFEDQAQRVKISGLPKGWAVATALPAKKVNALGAGDYEAPSYDALVDHPVKLGAFWRGEFTARGVRHEFVVAGAPADFDGDKLLADTRLICEAQLAFWHGRRKAPFDHYVFMLNAVEDGYGGLEHRQSTALICGRRDLPRTGRAVNREAYTTLLGLISHEYFHTWNVKRLKPEAFEPYDYTQENHTRMLWFFEGFTSYYDDQFLLRCGLIDSVSYLKLLSKTINQVLSTPGRQDYSVGQASFDAWTRYYRQDENTANATVSYYTKGSLVALALDLALRQLPQQGKHQPCLDGVMHKLWQLGRPITENDVAQALNDEAGALPPSSARPAHFPRDRSPLMAWQDLLHRWTEGTEDLPLESLLDAHGVRWASTPGSLSQRLGVRLSESPGVLKVAAVMRGSVAEQAGLSAGDECLALDGWRVKKQDDLVSWHDANKAQTLLVSRDGKVLSIALPAMSSMSADAGTPAASGQIVGLSQADRHASAEQASRRQAWLRA